MSSTTLQEAAADALTSFRNAALTVSLFRNDSSTDVDIYRTLRDVSSLLYETQLVRDMFDSDPFGLSWRMDDGDDDEEEESKEEEEEEENNDHADKNNNNADKNNNNDEGKKNNRILQIQNMLQVTSCHRTTTPHGYSSISAIVHFNIHDDGVTDNNNTLVKNNIRLRFNFVREPAFHYLATTTSRRKEQQFQYSSSPAHGDDTESNDKHEEEEEEEEKKDDDDEEEEVLTNRITPEQKQQQQHPIPASKKRKIMINDNDKEDDEDVDDSSISSAQSPILPPQQQQPQQQQQQQQKYETQISYKIEYSIDYGKFESLLGIDIYAINNYPSIYPAIPIIDNYNGEDEEGDGCADGCCGGMMPNDLFLPPNLKNINDCSSSSSNGINDSNSNKNNNHAEEDVEMSNIDVYDEEEDEEEDDEDGSSNYITTETNTAANAADRYGVNIHLQNIVTFLDCTTTNINLTERSIFYFLLQFPYYEHEWDIAGFIISSIYNNDVNDEDDVDDDDRVS